MIIKGIIKAVIIIILSESLLGAAVYTGGPRHSFDVLSYKLDINIYNCFKPPYPKSFSAVNTLSFRVDSVLSSIKLNANNYSLTTDSVELTDNSNLTFSHNQNLLTITLDRIYNPGETIGIRIYYRHNNVQDSAFLVNQGIVFTDCEPEGARKWFPCWDKPTDKALTDITVKTPSAVLLGSNGSLTDSIRSADTIFYRWVSRDPMSTYLVAIAGSSNYNLIVKYWHRYSNPLDSIPIRIYYNSWQNPSNVRDSIFMLADFFSQLYGDYAFEKIGFANGDSSRLGNMENQTLIKISPDEWNIWVAGHEFSHHWFGDLITCGTWADLWLNEGFGTYCDALVIEHLHGTEAYMQWMINYLNQYLSGNNTQPIYNPAWINNTPPDYLLFSVVNYSKAACVLYMLRNLTGDSVFFGLMKSYATDTNFTYKTAVTNDFIAKVNSYTSQDYTWFFDEWVKQPNHPKYTNTYGISNIGSGNWRVNFNTRQNLTYTVFHKMPMELRIKFHDASDTLVRILNDANNQTFTFNFAKQPDSLIFDPNNKIILKQVTMVIGVRESGKNIPDRFQLYQNYPNPFNASTVISFNIKESSQGVLKIFDVTGREVKILINEKLNPGSYSITIDLSDLSSGVYLYRLTAGNFKDVRKMVIIK